MKGSEVLEPYVRGTGDVIQVDFHVQPVHVLGGSEDLVLVSEGTFNASGEYYVSSVESFLGVQPGDIVEMAADVVNGDNLVVYNRSIHKETLGIYDAWDLKVPVNSFLSNHFQVTLTCRTNAENREGKLSALFEGLVRLTLES